jgi:hypothetical protein
MMKRLINFCVLFLIGFAITVHAQVTTTSINGKVTSGNKDLVIGATVKAIHNPSGTVYGAVTNADGLYMIQGMRPGGPYTITISYVGMKSKSVENVTLQLGETQKFSVDLEESTRLNELMVYGKGGVNANKTGAAMNINKNEITRMPSITHGIADVARLNPQLRVTNTGAMYFAGTNNRYNSFQIDGAMNNDVFGLTNNGSNGGQAGTEPVSMETIEQIQVNIAPYDVRQSGFTGGAINAITKSGTNEFHGSVYGYGNNQSIIGSKYELINGTNSDKYMDQSQYQTGFTIGGPIIKNKLFFFANYEKADQTYKNPYAIGNTASKVKQTVANEVLAYIKKIAAEQGVTYNGTLDATDVYTRSDKGGVKLDWNINEKNKASFRWSLVSARQLNSASTAILLNSSDYTYDFVSKTNSFVGELQSRLSNNLNNEFRASYVNVRDVREPGNPFPMIQVAGVGDGSVNIGNERSSELNSLDQDIFTVTDNLTWNLGKHSLTFGTHNEFYKFANLFIQDAYGTYYFASPDALYAGTIKQYRYGVANVDVTGDAKWKAKFSAGQVGFYAQDKMMATDNLDITLGVRVDLPLFFDTPEENAAFNTFSQQQGWNYKTNTKLNSTPLVSPRLGFRWNVDKDNNMTLRGGVGVFTGRIPFVWLSNNFSNTGIQLSTYNTTSTTGLSLILDPTKQTENVKKLTASGSQTINVFDKDFKFAQNLRANLAFDFKVAGIEWTAEGIYSKTLNDILYQNLIRDVNGKTFAEVSGLSFDTRPMLAKLTTTGASTYSGIYALSNTSEGYTYNVSLSAKKKFDFGLELMASYAYTQSKSLNSGTSSVAQSNFDYNYTHGNPNDPELSYSAFNTPHSIKASAFYTLKWNKSNATTIGLIYMGSSGSPYSIYYYGDLNGDGSSSNDLMYIPTDEQIDKMSFKATTAYTADQQKTNMKQWLANEDYLKDHRGEYFDRNAANEKFEHHFDLHLAHKFDFNILKDVRSLELSFDIVNIGNLLNKAWGETSSAPLYYSPVTYSGSNGSNLFQFLHDGNYTMHSYADYYSRWRGQIGLKFTF